MLACCAHHLSDVLPILGVSGAAVFLSAYQTPLLWLGLAMNLAGIGYLLWQIHGIHATPGVSRVFQGVAWPASKRVTGRQTCVSCAWRGRLARGCGDQGLHRGSRYLEWGSSDQGFDPGRRFGVCR
jgi:hypothetical protein